MLEAKIRLRQSITFRLTTKIFEVKNGLPPFSSIKIRGFYGFNHFEEDIVQLHICTDLSQLAYGTCAYFRFLQSGDIKVTVVASCVFKLENVNNTKVKIAGSCYFNTVEM